MNFAIALTDGRLRALRTTVTTPIGSPDAARATIIDQVLAGDVSESTRATVARASTAPQAIALLLGSPEFQKR
jgi:uncharacterized protein (DUF1800 family)